MDQQWHRDLIGGRIPGVGPTLMRFGLAGLSHAYRAAVAARNATFDWRLRPAHSLGRRTISVGNLTVGGTGKTPMVIDLSRRLRDMARRPAVLLRGYAASDTGSDEAAELQAALGPDIPVEANPNRRAGARAVLQRGADFDTFVLDDAFQHRQVARDVDIVLIDATLAFGYGRMLPRGLLREPIKSLRRADAVVLTRCDQVPADAVEATDRILVKYGGKASTTRVSFEWARLHGPHGETPVDALRSMRVASVCGVGNPQSFELLLGSYLPQVVMTRVYNDHYDYNAEELRDLFAEAKHRGTEAVVTTQKDWVKWRQLLGKDETPLPVLRPELAVRYESGQAELMRLLEG